MAQKKITDLQLISAIADGLSIPTDDGIITYRLTVAQLVAYILADASISLPMLDIDILTGLSTVTPLVDDYLPIIDTSDSNKTKKVLLSNFVQTAYRSVVTTDTATLNDSTLVLSGASFVQTLPTAVGCAGKRFLLLHNGTSISQVYTLATTSSQTVGAYASSAIKLATKGEELWVESNGANWLILNHYTFTANSTPVTMTFTASTSGTYTPGTTTAKTIGWFRRGRNAHIVVDFRQTGAGTNGVGNIEITLPDSLIADTTLARVYTGTTALTSASYFLPGELNGQAGGSFIRAKGYLYDSTHLCFFLASAEVNIGIWGNGTNGFGLGNATTELLGEIVVPIANWID